MRPAGLHLAITVATCYDWKEFVKAIKDSVALMKEDPTLNHNSNVATYGMASTMPSSTILDDMSHLYHAALLDAL